MKAGREGAGDLQPGDLILSLDGDYGVVDSVVIAEETQTMYDLDVETVDTFAVGDGAWVVHNCDTRRVLILGEEANAPYARWLANEHPDWCQYTPWTPVINGQSVPL